jgi:protease-4
MKNFFTSLLGALVALFIFTFGGFILFLGILGAIASLSSQKAALAPHLESGSYLVFDLSTNIIDSPPNFDLGGLFAGSGNERNGTLQLRTVIRAIRGAGADSRIKGIFLKGSLQPAGYGSGYAALREVREALTAFRASGKPVKAYLQEADTRDYYVVSAANEIVLDPYGDLFFPGLAAETPFVAGAFEKYGVGVQVTRVGKYKSAIEIFTRTDMSPESREETQQLLNDIWGSLLAQIGSARGLTPAALQKIADTQGLIQPAAAKEARLVDRIADRDQIADEIKAEAGPGVGKESFRQISLQAYAKLDADPALRTGAASTIAVVYAEGEIVDGQGELGQVGGEKFAAELRELRKDSRVKAVVLRVNSPGGSVLASEEIEREIKLIRQSKPVVVSMGAYAASGGYWISANSDRIFAEPTTITGSIGVFGVQFDIQKLLANWGITFDRVKTGQMADAETITRPKTDQELAIIQSQVDWYYNEFINRVAAGRKLPRARVEEIAQGRVWSGQAAKKIGLVDEIGGLRVAIGYAAKLANLGQNFRLDEFPGKKDLREELKDLFGRMTPESRLARDTGLVGQMARQWEGQLAALRAFNDPQGLYARLPLEMEIK